MDRSDSHFLFRETSKMADKSPRKGLGMFQWNRGAWFGGQIGGTAWLIPAGLIFLAKIPIVGIVWLGIFAAINAIGYRLWSRRDRLNPYHAIQILLVACGIGGLCALGALVVLRPEASLPEIEFHDWKFWVVEDRRTSLRSAFLFFLVGIPLMMGWFHLAEQSARKAIAAEKAGKATSDAATSC
jgi:hypothetical protein